MTGRLAPPDSGTALRTLPPDIIPDEARWRPARVEPSGLVNLTRIVGNSAGPQPYNVFGGAGRGMALARTTIVADGAGVRHLELGFSDQVSVFLDGTLVYSGDNSYEAPGSDLGRVRYTNASIDLALTPGRHALVLAVTDRNFGWGFEARWKP